MLVTSTNRIESFGKGKILIKYLKEINRKNTTQLN